MSVSTTGASEETNAIHDFQGYPPEMRNAIYEVAFAQHAEDGFVDITKEWPAVTRVNRQMRSETVKLFLASTDFIAHVQMRNGSYDRLLRWLDMLGDRVRHVKTLTIVCADDFWRMTGEQSITSALDHWSYIGSQLQKRGLSASQFRLPVISHDLETVHDHRSWELAEFLTNRCIYVSIIAGSILLQFGLIDENTSQRAMVDELLATAQRETKVGRNPTEWLLTNDLVEDRKQLWMAVARIRKLNALLREGEEKLRKQNDRLRQLGVE